MKNFVQPGDSLAMAVPYAAGVTAGQGMLVGALFGVAAVDGVQNAVIEGATLRFRPEVLSVMIGALALIPLLFSNGTGVEIEKPLAAVVVGGLLARPLKIVVLPVFYYWIEKRAAEKAVPAAEISSQAGAP